MKQNTMGLFLWLVCVSSFAQNYRVGDHELLVMPTAYTMPKGSAYFSSYELFFMNYNRAISDRTHIGIFSMFPVTTDFLETVTLGLKHNYFRGNTAASSFWGSVMPKSKVVLAGNVVSIGEPRQALHLGMGVVDSWEEEDDSAVWLYLAGYNFPIGRRTDMIVEYSNFSLDFLDDDDLDFNGLITLGFRFRSQSISWMFGGFRPLEDTGDEFLFFPYLKATLYFGND